VAVVQQVTRLIICSFFKAFFLSPPDKNKMENHRTGRYQFLIPEDNEKGETLTEGRGG
jgi:hypothetical protein